MPIEAGVNEGGGGGRNTNKWQVHWAIAGNWSLMIAAEEETHRPVTNDFNYLSTHTFSSISNI